MKDAKIQWHPGFVAAINLEFAKDRKNLIFEKEYNLNTKPLEIDLLVIKKEASVRIKNEIGALFRGHNIMEYKSPDDSLDIDAFYKTGAYASLYKSYGKTLDAIKADDVTVSLVREAKPEGLFRYLKEHHYSISTPNRGIYYIEGPVLFPTQIIVTRELNDETHIWLTALSDRMEMQNMKRLLKSVTGLSGKADREFADSVLEVSVGANKQVINKLLGDDSMCQALLEIMEPQLQLIEKRMREEVREKVREEVQEKVREEVQEKIREEDIKITIGILRRLGHKDSEIEREIMQTYALSEKDTRRYL